MIVTFGTIGLAIPLAIFVMWALGIKSEAIMMFFLLWPTSIFWQVGPGGLLGVGWAILTNVLLYALGGWFVGGIWQMIHDFRSGE
jgi:hypothetical protein